MPYIILTFARISNNNNIIPQKFHRNETGVDKHKGKRPKRGNKGNDEVYW